MYLDSESSKFEYTFEREEHGKDKIHVGQDVGKCRGGLVVLQW